MCEFIDLPKTTRKQIGDGKTKFSWFEKIVICWTQKYWHKYLISVSTFSYEKRFIDSKTLHIIACLIDPTQYKVFQNKRDGLYRRK